ncbi:uncharacterized protein N7511_005372 [Penicillium nucicola]|uniref:uncharacterized protein n=1 Tax=Penicillium nucicola TaxID=1850975 RepID=UPI00254537F6|nr:uncharacterized protein N7511_005372 [Penicillium nucicola]KAJ5761990.1 hypothetical protein N7511_005372 [Penicillium nucicola]
MPRGRPKVLVSPCRFCKMQFKRVEHLQRHERIREFLRPHFLLFVAHRFQILKKNHFLAIVERTFIDGIFSCATVDLTITDPPWQHVQNLDTFQSSPIPVGRGTGPVQQGSWTPSAAVSELHSEHSNYTGFMPHDPADSFDFTSTYEFEMLWNNSNDIADFLPAAFFDTDFSLSDIWQTNNQKANKSMGPPLSLEPNRQDLLLQNADVSQSFSSLPSRLPNLEPDSLSSRNERLPHNKLDSSGAIDVFAEAETALPWNISVHAYDQIYAAIQTYGNILPSGFPIPSRHTVSRYVEGYFRGFHEHFPFLHPPNIKGRAFITRAFTCDDRDGCILPGREKKRVMLFTWPLKRS